MVRGEERRRPTRNSWNRYRKLQCIMFYIVIKLSAWSPFKLNDKNKWKSDLKIKKNTVTKKWHLWDLWNKSLFLLCVYSYYLPYFVCRKHKFTLLTFQFVFSHFKFKSWNTFKIHLMLLWMILIFWNNVILMINCFYTKLSGAFMILNSFLNRARSMTKLTTYPKNLIMLITFKK